MDADTLKKRMEPSHLLESLEGEKADEATEMLKKAEEVAKKVAQEPEEILANDPRNKIEYGFDFDYVDGHGKVWTGHFVNKILNEKERRNVGIMRAMMSGGQPFESLDGLTREMILIHAHLAVSLKEKPKWAENLDKLHDYQVLQALYDHVFEHERFFLGLDRNQNKG